MTWTAERPDRQDVAATVEPLDAAAPFALDGLGAIGLHCGCGLNLQPGWVNVDRVQLTGTDGARTTRGTLARVDGSLFYLQADLGERLPFADASVPRAHAEHVIEHLTLDTAVAWLREMHRVLAPGAVLRISTPDLARYAAAYRGDDPGFFARHRDSLAQIGFTDIPDRPAWMVNQLFRFWGHQWIYDFDELRTVAVHAGFEADEVTRRSFGDSAAPELAELDLPVREPESLYAELRRAG